ncbi:MAG: hypothetical protein RIS94_1591, partial [Pseudomonadota bacterium]
SMLEALPLVLFEASSDGEGRLQRAFVAGDLSRIAGDHAASIEAGDVRWEDRIHPEDQPMLSLNGHGGKQAVSFEYRWRAEGQDIRHFIEQCVCISDHGEPPRWAGTLMDVTERKQMEAQLLQAGKVEAIGRLTGGVAHDFNNLLAAVLGGLHLLERRQTFSAPDQMVVERMRQAAEKGVELVKRMMAFARKQELQPVAVAPASLCASVAGLVEHALGGTVTIDWRCACTDANFLVDRSQLELALVNLILNARDAMPAGGAIAVEISQPGMDEVQHAGLPPGPYLSVSVTDEGTGIPQSILNKITEPFFTTKEAGKGTGLGLSMVVGFVHQSGGKLEIHSDEGVGTRIAFLLPATLAQAHEKSGMSSLDEPEDLRGRSILVVDDDEAVRTLMVEQLQEWGMEVTGAADGRAALKALADSPGRFELVLTDYAMPGLSGAELVRKIGAMADAPRCLIMTGYADEKVQSELPPGVCLLHKPVAPDLLKRSLAEARHGPQ